MQAQQYEFQEYLILDVKSIVKSYFWTCHPSEQLWFCVLLLYYALLGAQSTMLTV